MYAIYNVKFMFSKKAQKLAKSSSSIWHYAVSVKSTAKILSFFVAFLENTNLKKKKILRVFPKFLGNSVMYVYEFWREMSNCKFALWTALTAFFFTNIKTKTTDVTQFQRRQSKKKSCWNKKKIGGLRSKLHVVQVGSWTSASSGVAYLWRIRLRRSQLLGVRTL